MNKQEKIKLIAEKVMGWVRHNVKTTYWVYPMNADKVDLMRWDVLADEEFRRFNPYAKDAQGKADCMDVWMKFAGTCKHLYLGSVPCPKKYGEEGSQIWRAVKGLLLVDDSVWAFDKDMQTAMMDCVVKAVSK